VRFLAKTTGGYLGLGLFRDVQDWDSRRTVGQD
jgi:hypothetical protein